MSIIGTAIFHPASNCSVVTCGTPSSMSDMSVLVPPMSNPIRLLSPTIAPKLLAPATPPAGPDRIAFTAWFLESSIGVTPPFDCMIRMSFELPNAARRSSKRVRYFPNTGPTYELITVVLSLSYSLICGRISCDRDVYNPGANSSMISPTRRSCSGFR